jgi:hypothetical protein
VHRISRGCSQAFVILAWILIAINTAYCWWENKARLEGRRADNVIKYQRCVQDQKTKQSSVVSAQKLMVRCCRLVDEGKTKAPIGDRSPEFLFTI